MQQLGSNEPFFPAHLFLLQGLGRKGGEMKTKANDEPKQKSRLMQIWNKRGQTNIGATQVSKPEKQGNQHSGRVWLDLGSRRH